MWYRALKNYSMAVLLLGTLSHAGQSMALNISDTPLFQTITVDPNVFFELDDSGSMDWEILTKTHWHYCAYDPKHMGQSSADSVDCGWLVDNGLWRMYDGTSFSYFEYIFNDGDHAYSGNCTDSRERLESCTNSITRNRDWRIRSAQFNVTYYNPLVTYKPWEGNCTSSTCTDASFTAALSDPRQGTAGNGISRNLDGFVYTTWTDDKGFSGARPQRGNNVNVTSGANGLADLWDSHTKYTITGGNIVVEEISCSPTTSDLNCSVVSTTTLSGAATLNGRTIDEVKQNIANWYSYYRRRSFVAKAAVSGVIDEVSGVRYGLSVINQYSSLFTELPSAISGPYTSHNSSLLTDLYDFNWPAAGTPLRSALKRTGDYYANNLSGKADPIRFDCQKNYTVLVTDGYWNGASPSVGDIDGDGISDTVADVAYKYYDTDLDTNRANKVPPDTLDPKETQHMVTFTVAFGVEGNLAKPANDGDGDGWPDLDLSGNTISVAGNWGNATSCSDCPEKIDDLAHAAYNSKGLFVGAQDPQQMITSLKDILSSVSGRNAATASVALTTGQITAGSFLYQAKFNSADSDWTGQLLAVAFENGDIFNTNGDLNIRWDAGEKIPDFKDSSSTPGNGSRNIFTYNGSSGIPFTWSSLSTAQKTSLDTNITGNNDGLGQSRLSYLRGNTANEQRNGGTFRSRPTYSNGDTILLGDVINSNPAYVGRPPFTYNFDGYVSWAGSTSMKTRQPMVYVGANDGMLHAFNAKDGSELFAYVPSGVYDNLSKLTSPNYTHKFFVDGSPVMGDIYDGSNWRTILVSGLNKGGKSMFALDITDPTNFGASDVLWEFSDSELGYTFGKPVIALMNNNQWVVIFGNGYNSTSEKASLFIVDAITGSLVKRIDTAAGSSSNSNGMSGVGAVDLDGDFKVDFIYAGDIIGNLWKFDVQDASTSKWAVAYSGGSTPAPFYEAKNSSGTPQPIISSPVIGRFPSGVGLMVYFGTGKYLENADNITASYPTQSFYGIWDQDADFETSSNGNGGGKTSNKAPSISRSNLVQQTITTVSGSQQFCKIENGTSVCNTFDVRTVSNSPMLTSDMGWYMDLPEAGERVINTPILRDKRIIFTTLIPSSDACDSGGTGWLMEVNSHTGSRTETSPFDLNEDGYFNEGDETGGNPVNGIKPDVGIPSNPTIGIPEDGDEAKFVQGSTGRIMRIDEEGTRIGRQSWQQLR